jgi:hypothetical protein
MSKRFAKLTAISPDAIGRVRELAKDMPSTTSDAEIAAFVFSCDGDADSAAAKWTAAQATKATLGPVSIREVAQFLRSPSSARTYPDGCMFVLEDMNGDVARDNLGRPVCACIGMQHGSAAEMQQQMVYVMSRLAAYAKEDQPPCAACVVIDVVPQEKGAPPSFRFPDKDVRTLFDLQTRAFPGAQFSTTHFCGLPRFVTFAFRLVRPFMSKESYEAMVLKPSFAHLSSALPRESMLPRWGGDLHFDLDAYVEWRATEEGIDVSELPARGAGRSFDAKAAAAAAETAFRESMESGAGGTISSHSLICGEPNRGADKEAPAAVKHGEVEKRGSGRGLFSTKRWKRKLLALAPTLGLVYFDGVEISESNHADTVIPLDGGVTVEACEADGSGPAHQFEVRTASRSYLFGVPSRDKAEEWVRAVQSQIEATRAQAGAAIEDMAGQTTPLTAQAMDIR